MMPVTMQDCDFIDGLTAAHGTAKIAVFDAGCLPSGAARGEPRRG